MAAILTQGKSELGQIVLGAARLGNPGLRSPAVPKAAGSSVRYVTRGVTARSAVALRAARSAYLPLCCVFTTSNAEPPDDGPALPRPHCDCDDDSPGRRDAIRGAA